MNFRERELPRLLVGIIDLAQLLWIHAEFARHLNVSVRETVPLTRVDPDLKSVGGAFAGHAVHTPRDQWRYASNHSAPLDGGVGSGSSSIGIA